MLCGYDISNAFASLGSIKAPLYSQMNSSFSKSLMAWKYLLHAFGKSKKFYLYSSAHVSGVNDSHIQVTEVIFSAIFKNIIEHHLRIWPNVSDLLQHRAYQYKDFLVRNLFGYTLHPMKTRSFGSSCSYTKNIMITSEKVEKLQQKKRSFHFIKPR